MSIMTAIIAFLVLVRHPVCKVEDGILVYPFRRRNRNYNFHGTCEHILVASCDMVPSDLAVTVDFLPSNLDMGRVGVRLGSGKKIVIDKELNVTVVNLVDPISQAGGINIYVDDITVIETPNEVVVSLDALGVSITRVGDGVSISVRDGLTNVCVLCGTINGTS